ncbi:MAG: hypothetical protein JXA54_01070 [Candidatus Heimdallarchaeota archaeon]|nr:hypothetical protein [Candidatus Heimdallarchaeota archaeon]
MKKIICINLILLMLISAFFPLTFFNNKISQNESFIKNKISEEECSYLDKNLKPKIYDWMKRDILLSNITNSYTITRDGNLSDWSGLPFERLDTPGNINASFAFDQENIYMAFQWFDNTFDNGIGYFEKVGMLNDVDADWDFISGYDDMLFVTFANETYIYDTYVWTASNRTDGLHAYELLNYKPDNGTHPTEVNSNIGYLDAYEIKPIFDNSHIPIVDYASIPIGTKYAAYYPLTPTDSQIDMEISWNWNETLSNGYTFEIVRKLNTGHSDDIILNFANYVNNYTLLLGSYNKYDTKYWQTLYSTNFGNINLKSLKIGTTNAPANFTFNTLDAVCTNELALSGFVEDDFFIESMEVRVSGWIDTFGFDCYKKASYNDYSNQWTSVLKFNPNDLPLGEQKINVTLKLKYEDDITLSQTIFVQDNLSPIILGIIDLSERYPYGVEGPKESIEITAGLLENYSPNNLTATLYYKLENEETFNQTIMKQFYLNGVTFNGLIPLIEVNVSTPNQVYYNYTNYVIAKDLANNSVISDVYHFIYPKMPTNESHNIPVIAYALPIALVFGGLIILLPIILISKKIK